MKSTLNMQAREGVDTLYTSVDGCRFVMLLDLETALVLCANSDAKLSQDARDRFASQACKTLRFPRATAFEMPGEEAETHSVARFGNDGVTIAVKKTGVPDVALVCQFDVVPDRASLDAAAIEVLGLFEVSEAA